jgi:hypothetical protein
MAGINFTDEREYAPKLKFKNNGVLADVISRFSIQERFRLEEKLVKMITEKRPYYKTVKKREVVRDTVSDLLDAIVQNGL